MAAIHIVGGASMLAALITQAPPGPAPVWEVLLYALLALLAGGRKVQVIRGHQAGENGSLTLGLGIIFAAMLRGGPAAGCLAAVLSCLSSCVYPRRQPLPQLLINLSLSAAQSWLAGACFLILNGDSLVLSPIYSLPAVACSSLVYFCVNSAGVVGVIALTSGDDPARLWRDTALDTAPTYLASASIIGLTIIASQGQVGTVLLFGAPVAFLTFHAFAASTALMAEKQRRIEELQQSEARLAEMYARSEELVRDRSRHVEMLERNAEEIAALNARLQRAMAETHHRVKNNLQIVTAMVDMQVMEGRDLIPVEEMRRLGQHVRCLASIHDLLTHQAKARGDALFVSTKEALDRLMPLVRGTTGARAVYYRVDDALLPVSQGTSLVVLINELVSNAVKHGLGEIQVSLEIAREEGRLEVSDDGPGFPPGFDPVNAANTGLELVESLSRWDLQGEPLYENRPGGGARVVVRFPVRGQCVAVAA